MSDDLARPYSLRHRLPWLVGGVACALLGLSIAWSMAEPYRALRSLSCARASGWLALIYLALALCISPLARIRERLAGQARWPYAARLRRVLGMTSAWLALVHASLGFVQLHDPVRNTLHWLLDTAHVRAGTAALLILVTLLMTSYPRLVRVLQLRAWKELHRLAYVAFACAMQHVLLSPFAPRIWVWSLGAGTLLIGMLRMLPVRGNAGRHQTAKHEARTHEHER